MTTKRASECVEEAVPGFFRHVGLRVLDTIFVDAQRAVTAYEHRGLSVTETIAALESVCLAARAWCQMDVAEGAKLAQSLLEDAMVRLARAPGTEFANTNTNTNSRDPSASYETESEIESEGPLANSSSSPNSNSSAPSDSDSRSDSARGASDSDSCEPGASRPGFDAEACAAAQRPGSPLVSADAGARLLGQEGA